jgi:hypothetical protein
MSRPKKLPAVGAGITSTLTAVDIAYLLSAKTPGLWLFCLIAAILGVLLTVHLLECAGLMDQHEANGLHHPDDMEGNS